MKNTPKNQPAGVTAMSQVTIGAAIAALPFAVVPSLQAQVKDVTEQPAALDRPARQLSPSLTREICCLKFAERYHKEGSSYTLVGTDQQHPVYRNARNEYFYLDPATGDMVFVAPEAYMKQAEGAGGAPSRAAPKMLRPVEWKNAGKVTILGLDQAGHVVQQNARGEIFYLDPNTGDMVFSK